MKIRTQLIISVVLFCVALLIVAAAVAITNQKVEQINNQQDLVKSIELGAGELGYLSNDYLLYTENPQLERWNSKYAEFSGDVANLSANTLEQRALVDSIRAGQLRLNDVFGNVKSTKANGNLANGNATDRAAYIEVSWSRLAVQTRGIIFDASHLSQLLQGQENQVKQTSNLLIMALLVAFGAFILVDYLLVFGGTIKSIGNLRAGTKVIGSGNLDYTIKSKQDDEVGELANAFNQMTGRLKAVTASKADLEKEITERKRAEQAVAEEKQQAELYLDLMGHDISNMHQIILGQLQLAEEIMSAEGKLDAGDRELIDTSINNLLRSAKLIDNVKNLQMLRAGEFSLEPVDLDEVLNDAVAAYSRIPDKHVTIDYTPAHGHVVMVNPVIKEVFNNLIDNAVKHSGDPVRVGIAVSHIEINSRQYHMVSIEDNGPGIPDNKKKEVFHRLRRGQTKARGTGLGLYLVKTLVESFRGIVELEDRVKGDYSQGSRFLVYLPAVGGENHG